MYLMDWMYLELYFIGAGSCLLPAVSKRSVMLQHDISYRDIPDHR